MNDRLSKIKQHFKENKKAYLAGIGGVAVGTTAALIYAKAPGVNVKPIQVLTWKSKQTVEVFIEALGDPGNIVQDLETGTVWASQGQAARELGVSPSTVSKHLRGVIPDVMGRKLTILGKAPVLA